MTVHQPVNSELWKIKLSRLLDSSLGLISLVFSQSTTRYLDGDRHSVSGITHIQWPMSHLRLPGAVHRCWICSSSGCSENTSWRWRYRPRTPALMYLLPETTLQPARSRWPLQRMSQRRAHSWPLVPGSQHGGSGCRGQETVGTPQSPLQAHSRWSLTEGTPVTNRGSWRRWAQQRPL